MNIKTTCTCSCTTFRQCFLCLQYQTKTFFVLHILVLLRFLKKMCNIIDHDLTYWYITLVPVSDFLSVFCQIAGTGQSVCGMSSHETLNTDMTFVVCFAKSWNKKAIIVSFYINVIKDRIPDDQATMFCKDEWIIVKNLIQCKVY